MRKIFLLVSLTCLLLLAAVAQAAQVTDVKWGVDKNNVLRFVVDLTDTASYAVDVDDSALRLTVNAEPAQAALGSKRIKSAVADTMQVAASGSDTVIRVPLKQALAAGDYKSFVLKKDPATGRPFRVVLDVTAAQHAATQTTVAAAPTTVTRAPVTASPSSKPVTSVRNPYTSRAKAAAGDNQPIVSNRPVVSNTPTRGGVVKTNPVAVATPKKDDTDKKKTESKKDEDKKKTDEKNSDSKKSDNKKQQTDKKDGKAIKGSGKFRTDGGIKGKIITLDAGHGGSDPGAIGASGTKEKEITLAITKLVQDMLEDKGAKVYMTRTKDVDVYGPNASDVDELQARVNVGEKYNSDLFISLHINSSVNKNVGGFSTYYFPKTDNDLRLANAIQKQLTSNFGVDDMGVRQANFYVIKRISMPAVLLEMCFISNPKEEKLMKSKWFQKKTARLIVEGIEKYFD